MKKLLLSITLIMVLLPFKNLTAQDYRPMAVDSVRWIVGAYDHYYPWILSLLWEYYALGDTVVNDTEYIKIYKRTLDPTNSNPPFPATSEYSLVALMRDDIENRKVYVIALVSFFIDCPSGEEVLLFDFSLNEGDIATHQCTVPDGCGDVIIEETGNGIFYGVATRYFELGEGCSGGLRYYEGIGSDRGLFEGLATPVKGVNWLVSFLDYYCPTSDCPYIVSSNQLHAPTGIKAYPNPAQNAIFVEMPQIVQPGNSKVELYNIEGRLVYQSIPVSLITQIPVQNLSSGLYLLRVWDGSKWTGSKVVKE
ncbi:MAG: T9SS type A sorting domain-containing protein [Lentimicrobium sp.]|nr:T9SS type A sorting domain-containing protein [Lentimicrobium sp.]